MATSTDESEDVIHPIFTRQPEELRQYVYKEVCVLSEDGETHTGRVYTVDPVSETIVLVKLLDGQMTDLKLVFGHTVQKITVLDNDTSVYKEALDGLFNPNPNNVAMTPEELDSRRALLKSWLLKNRLPVQESPDGPHVLSISDALFIEPPYTAESCRSTNEIILGRVRGLIKNMPPNVDDW